MIAQPQPDSVAAAEAAPPPAPADALRPGALASLWRSCWAGFFFGALAYGAPMALIHLVDDGVRSVRDAVAAYGGFLVLYGLWAAGAFMLGWVLAWIWGRLRRRPVAGETDSR